VQSPFRRLAPTVGLSLAAVVAMAASAQQATTARRTLDGSALGGSVLPVSPIDGGCSLSALRATRWKVDDTQRLLLEGEVRVAVGGYSFTARRAAVWINRLPIGADAVTQVAVWFEEAHEPTRRAGLGASGRDLLVTATIEGSVQLAAVTTADRVPPRDAFIAAAEARLSSHLRSLLEGPRTLAARPSVDAASREQEAAPVPGAPLLPRDAVRAVERPASVEVALASSSALPIFEPSGTVSFSAESVVIDEREDRVVVTGMVELEYLAAATSAERRLQLVAERGVIFLSKGAVKALREGGRSLEAKDVEGIYLEGAVQATDGEYALRGAKIYYDLATNRAAIVDAVLRTYDRRRGELPIYTRAAELRQVAADQWTAERATVSTSEFFTPHLAIGVERVTVTQRDAAHPEGAGVYVRAEGAALAANGKGILPLPGYEGYVERLPVRSIEVGYEEDRGVEIGTEWDLFSLAGLAPVDGVDATLLADAFTERGAALGTRVELGESLGSGAVELYGLYDTGGNDRTSSGLDVEVDAGMRGIVDAQWQQALAQGANLQLQAAWLSDETFATAWRESDFNARREFETSAYFNGLSGNSALTFLVKRDLNDFISNSYLLASRGYTVDKLPELAYRRYGDQPFEGVTWTQQWSAAAMSLRPTTGTPDSLGVPTGAWGDAIASNGSIEQAYLDAGYDDQIATRLDTRHEFSVPFSNEWGTFTPFATGQGTAYLADGLDEYTSDVDSVRLQAGVGARASMRIMRVDESVQSRLLDLNRMRHIVEPYGLAWGGYDSLEPGDLPVYDQEYEGAVSQGSALNLGVRSTWQTQRGGAGAWRSVDWLKLDTGVVISDEGSEFTPEPVDPLDPTASLRWAQSPIPAFFSFRPELSQWGSHLYGASTWQLSDALSVGGTANYLFEDRDFITDEDSWLPNLARASLGVEMRHSPITSTFVEYRYLAPTLSELLQAGVLYRAGKLYLIAVSPQYDIREGEFRAVTGSLTRTFPDFDLSATSGYDLIEDRTFVGISLSIPAGSRTGAGAAYAPVRGSLR